MHLSKTLFLLAAGGVLFSLLAFNRPDKPKEKKKDQTEVPEETLFLKVYNNIIVGNCAIPACHDGSFEPNFLTPQSTYYTVVQQPVIKKDHSGFFDYRVVPGDTSRSILIERLTNCCFNDPQDKMPLLGEALSKQQIDSIALWIMEGAPDWKGAKPYLPVGLFKPTNDLK